MVSPSYKFNSLFSKCSVVCYIKNCYGFQLVREYVRGTLNENLSILVICSYSTVMASELA